MNALLLVVSCFAFPSDAASVPAPPPQEMPAPGPEHERMKAWAGEFTFVNKMVMEPGQPPTESKGTASIRLDYNGYFLIDDTKGEMMGSEFRGHGITGYDPNKKKYIGTWVDNMGPWMLTHEGTYDEKTKALTMGGEMLDPRSGKMVRIRMVTTHTDADHMRFEWFQPGPDGKEVRTMEIDYTRKK